MQAIQITGPGTTKLVEVSKPQAGAGEVLLKIHYVGFCGSDLSTFRGLNPLVKIPVVPGHEIAATIAAIGPGVPLSFHVGDHVTVIPYTSCGTCSACRNDRENACRYNETLGIQRDGSMTEYLVMPWQKILVENDLTLRELTLVEPMSVGFHAIDRAVVSDTDTVLVFGCGMIGVGAIVRAVLRGATVIAVDVNDHKLALAKELGAHFAINSSVSDLAAKLNAITKGNGPEVVIEAVGRPETYQASVELAGFTARVVYIGYAKHDISFNTSLIVKKELSILGSRNARVRDFQAVIGLMKKKSMRYEKLITGIYAPQDAQRALTTWNEEGTDVFRYLLNFTNED